ncbi:magnesium/cobalt transporter CorA [Candidatus Woesearchaeota archaeon]|nr:magnesium/cobalt transporter CorA [Candidatus Woesearchaeota archaeon]
MIELYYLDAGTLRKGSANDIPALGKRPHWVDCTSITLVEAELLKTTYGLHPLTEEDLVHQRTRIKVEDFPGYLFCVFYGIRNGKSYELHEMDFVLGSRFLITNRKKELSSYVSLKKDGERLAQLLRRGSDFLMHKLLDNEVDNYFPVLESIDKHIERIDEQVTQHPERETLREILSLKKQIVRVKRACISQRDKAAVLAKGDTLFISKKAVPYFRDINDHLVRITDAVDSYREAIGSTFDIYLSSVSNRMNEVMKVLTIFAAIFIPLTFLAGIYGMNFDYLPGLHWRYGYFALWGIFLLVGGGMLYYFKRKRWL